jgi:hypothetical protein
MKDPGREPTASSSARPVRRLRILDIMLLIAGVAVGFWLVLLDVKAGDQPEMERWLLGVFAVLGGCSVVGPPLLLWERRRDSRPWRAGQILWFTQGMASWLLWPPVVYSRFEGKKFSDSISGTCYYYGTPLMAIYVTSALLAGGWLRPHRRRARRRPWPEQLGLILGLLWACSGFYILYQFYKSDFQS